MSLNIFGVEIPTNMDALTVFGKDIDTLIVFGVTVWQKQKYYYVAFSGNGATSGSMEQQTMPVGVATKLRDNAYKRTGYSFDGWSSAAGGSREYTNGQMVTDIASAGDTKTLYALWQAITYYIQFNANGGTGNMPRQPILYDTSTALAANAYTRSGYTYTGWGTSPGGPVVYGNGHAVRNLKTDHGDVCNLYAIWLRNAKTIIDDNDDNRVGLQSNTVTVDCTDFHYVKFKVRGQVTDMNKPESVNYVYISCGIRGLSSKQVLVASWNVASSYLGIQYDQGSFIQNSWQWYEVVLDISSLSGNQVFSGWVDKGPGQSWVLDVKNFITYN